MPEEYKLLPRKLVCIDNGHPFTAEVWQKLHFVEGHDEPVLKTIPQGALDDVRCPVPGCGSLAKEADKGPNAPARTVLCTRGAVGGGNANIRKGPHREDGKEWRPLRYALYRSGAVLPTHNNRAEAPQR